MPSEETLRLPQQTFVSAGCQNCHSGTALTSDGRYNVGLRDETGETQFNPPSLRGVSQRPPFFHDGRAATLTDVLKSSHHDTEHPLTDEQVERLLILLKTL
jgi:cytochrome c peroxidase